MRNNEYIHEIELTNKKIKNKPREEFRKLLEQVKYLGYEVEQLSDGRKIVITKPGGKIMLDDYRVWIYNPKDSTLWSISHDQIKDELINKGKIDPQETKNIIDALERVYDGEEPDDVLQTTPLDNPTGEPPEVLLKAYKWIWGQEDCNHPMGKGRTMSWEGWDKKQGKWIKTGKGIVDLREELNNQII